MDTVQNLAVDISESSWEGHDEILEQLEEDELGGFVGITLGVGVGLGVWVATFLILRLL